MDLTLQEADFPLRLIPETPLSDDSLMRFCAANEALRVEREPNGEILIRTPAGSKTSKMNLRISRLLDEWAETDRRGVAFDSSGGFTLPDGSMRNPDSAWMLAQRWNTLSVDEQEGYAPVCPDFVIEVRTRSDRLPQLQTKMEQWIANGVEVAWLIDPYEKAVTVYRPGTAPECLSHPTSVQGTGPIVGFELILSRIWE